MVYWIAFVSFCSTCCATLTSFWPGPFSVRSARGSAGIRRRPAGTPGRSRILLDHLHDPPDLGFQRAAGNLHRVEAEHARAMRSIRRAGVRGRPKNSGSASATCSTGICRRANQTRTAGGCAPPPGCSGTSGPRSRSWPSRTGGFLLELLRPAAQVQRHLLHGVVVEDDDVADRHGLVRAGLHLRLHLGRVVGHGRHQRGRRRRGAAAFLALETLSRSSRLSWPSTPPARAFALASGVPLLASSPPSLAHHLCGGEEGSRPSGQRRWALQPGACFRRVRGLRAIGLTGRPLHPRAQVDVGQHAAVTRNSLACW